MPLCSGAQPGASQCSIRRCYGLAERGLPMPFALSCAWTGPWTLFEICGCPESRVGTCRALQGYDAGTRGTDPRPNTPLPVG
eukprot:4760360-Prymnesium_polylepis.1